MTPHPHQVDNARALVASIRRINAGLDTSDTGTGKSLTALIVAAALEREPFVICPLSVGPGWEDKMAAVGIKGGWLNYEKARRGGWTPPENSLVIFDEAHRCKSASSQQAQLLVRASSTNPVLLLSATPFSSPMETRALLHATRLCEWNRWYSMLPKFGCRRNRFINNAWQWDGRESSITMLRSMLADRMVKTKWTDVTGFPDLLIQPEAVSVSDPAAVDKALRVIAAGDKTDLTKMLHARMVVELAKVPAMSDMALDAEAQGHRVVAFFNFTESLRMFADLTATTAVIDGTTPSKQRAAIIRSWHTPGTVSARFLACNIAAAKEGIDLHDTIGIPVLALHSPTWSAQDARQAFGRTHRVGARSRSVQKILFAAGTLDERVLKTMRRKSDNIDLLTDSDLNPTAE